ncbi:MAG: 3-dehydroquinate synthase II family protein [Desulfovibrionales bacterium]
MSRTILFSALPFDKTHVTLALESGVDGVIVPEENAGLVRELGRSRVLTPEEFLYIELGDKKDEERAVAALKGGQAVILKKGWEIIPVENILAQAEGLGLEVDSLDSARLASGILERGAETVVVLPEAAAQLKTIVKELKLDQGAVELLTATVEEIKNVGLGHRVCVDTASLLARGQGMLVGNSSAFTFLVHAETESNPYVAARPFRINAGAVHSYAVLPGDKTRYLEELGPGDEILVVGADGTTTLATVGRIKTEIRPMLLIRAVAGERSGNIFLQNAETIRVVRPDGTPVSVVQLKPGDEILCRTDEAGRHFGMRITEEIREG